jgi:hypothetical protein
MPGNSHEKILPWSFSRCYSTLGTLTIHLSFEKPIVDFNQQYNGRLGNELTITIRLFQEGLPNDIVEWFPMYLLTIKYILYKVLYNQYI